MRLGVDMLGVQSPGSRGRGIGRYARSLVAAMLRVDPGTEYVLYSHPGLPTDAFPASPRARVRPLPPGPTADRALDALAAENPDGLDALLLLSPFELHHDYAPPAKPLNGLTVASVVHDLVAFLFQERHLTYGPVAARFYRNLERLRGYDALLTNSEATRGDCLRLLGAPARRVVSVGGASEPGVFSPGGPDPSPDEVAVLDRLGLTRPFVFGLSNMEERKNLDGLLGAFRALPRPLREAHQLALSGAFSESDAREVRRRASEGGILGSLVFTGPVSDGVLRTLYRRCAAFVFPSLFEGFGLPLLEAMHCGAVVIGGNNSSQPEVVGGGGLLAHAADPHDLAEALRRALQDPGLAAALRARATHRAGQFTWEASARTACAALAAAVGAPRPGRPDRRPRAAVVSAWPPRGGAPGEAALRRAGEWSRDRRVDLYHEAGFEPVLGAGGDRFGVFDHRLLGRNARLLGYRDVVFLDGPTPDHRFLDPLMRDHPGVVWRLDAPGDPFSTPAGP